MDTPPIVPPREREAARRNCSERRDTPRIRLARPADRHRAPEGADGRGDEALGSTGATSTSPRSGARRSGRTRGGLPQTPAVRVVELARRIRRRPALPRVERPDPAWPGGGRPRQGGPRPRRPPTSARPLTTRAGRSRWRCAGGGDPAAVGLPRPLSGTLFDGKNRARFGPNRMRGGRGDQRMRVPHGAQLASAPCELHSACFAPRRHGLRR
jgi:hypothetical protein